MDLKYRAVILSAILSISFLATSQRAEAFEINNNLGAGIGIPFGGFGVSYELEMNIFDSFAIGPSITVGSTGLAGSSTGGGVQLHFGDKDGLLRFGASYWSGTNTIVQTGFDTYEKVNGTTAGINLRIQLGHQRKNCIDVHILQILTPDKDELQRRFGTTTNESGNTKIGVGYIRRF